MQPNERTRKLVEQYFCRRESAKKEQQPQESSKELRAKTLIPWFDIVGDAQPLQLNLDHIHYSHLKRPLPPRTKQQQPALPKELYPEEHAKLNLSKEQQWDRILEDKRLKHQQNRLKKIEQERKQVSQYFRSKQSTDPQVHDRLYYQGIQDLAIKESAIAQVSAIVPQYPFKPEISDLASNLKGREQPLYRRVQQVLQRRREQLAGLKVQAINNSGLTFHPQINPLSEQIASQRPADVVQRLMQAALRKFQKKLQLQQKSEQQLREECSFKPRLNPVIDVGQVPAPLSAKPQTELFVLHQPQISKVSQYMVEADLERNKQDDEAKLRRLVQKPVLDKQAQVQRIAQQVYKQYTFKPTINQVSRETGKKKTIEELAHRKNDEEKAQQIREERMRKELSECRFKPEINQRSRQLANRFQPKSRARAEEVREELQYQRMKECTFQPKVNSRMPEHGQLKIEQLKGVEGFMKKVELKQRMQQEKEKLERERFRLEERYDAKGKDRSKKTELAPFSLSRGNVNSKKLLERELLEAERRECTHQPNLRA